MPIIPLKRQRRPSRRSRFAVLALALLPVAPRLSSAQRVLGPAEDATVVPRGLFRLGVQTTWSRANERFSDGLLGRKEGQPERLGIDFDVDSLGPSRFEPLQPLTGALQVLTGKSAVPSTLGRLRVDYDYSAVTTPISLEYGLLRRLTLGVVVPYVKTRNEVFVNPNPERTGGTMGINPALTHNSALAQNLALATQLNAAVTQLQGALTSCMGSSAPECAAINADRAGAAQLATNGSAVAAAVVAIYGTKTGEGSRFAPVQGSVIQKNIAARLAALSTDFGGYLGAPPGSQAGWITQQPAGAPLMGLADFNTIIADSSFGIGAVPMETVERSHIGDVEFGGKLLLYDGLGAQPPQKPDFRGLKFRLAVGGAYRLGTAQYQSPDDFADFGTGDGQDDIEGRVFADVLFGRRFWASFVGKYGVQKPDQQFERVPDNPHDPFPALYRKQYIGRDLGDYTAMEFSPRVSLSDALMFTATYSVYNKKADSYTGTFNATDLSGDPVTIDASILNAGTERKEQRFVAGFTYSTMAAYYRGRAKRPLEVSYVVGQSLSGSGLALKQFTQAIGLRLYIPLFAAPEARPARPTRR